MAFLQCEFHSDSLGKACSMNVILPQKVHTQIGMASSKNNGEDGKLPVLYLLHGLSDDHSIWCRRTSIERYVAQYPVAVVMPDGGRSFYTDAANGAGKYWTFLSKELPQIVRSLFPVTSDPAKTFAAGLSMGGYGALKLGLRCPENFAAVAALSAVTDIPYRLREKTFGADVTQLFGSEKQCIENGNDLFSLAEKTVKCMTVPRIYQVCGTEDFLYEDNCRFHDKLLSLHWPNYEFHTAPGVHCWEFWDVQIQAALAFLLK